MSAKLTADQIKSCNAILHHNFLLGVEATSQLAEVQNELFTGPDPAIRVPEDMVRGPVIERFIYWSQSRVFRPMTYDKLLEVLKPVGSKSAIRTTKGIDGGTAPAAPKGGKGKGRKSAATPPPSLNPDGSIAEE